MCLGFAEWAKVFPNPHTKYNKFWVDNAMDMTVKELIAAVNKVFESDKLTVTAVSGPAMRVEKEKTEEDPSTVGAGAKTIWNESRSMKATWDNLDKKWVPLLKELTTRSESFLTLDDPIDVTAKLLYADLSISLENEDGDEVECAPIVLKLGDFDFVSYNDRPAKPATPWL